MNLILELPNKDDILRRFVDLGSDLGFGDLEKNIARDYINDVCNFLHNIKLGDKKEILEPEKFSEYYRKLSNLNNGIGRTMNHLTLLVKDEKNDGTGLANEFSFQLAISYAVHSELVLRIIKDIVISEMRTNGAKALTAGQIKKWFKKYYSNQKILDDIDENLRNAILHMDFQFLEENNEGWIKYWYETPNGRQEKKKTIKEFFMLTKKVNVLYVLLLSACQIEVIEKKAILDDTLVRISMKHFKFLISSNE